MKSKTLLLIQLLYLVSLVSGLDGPGNNNNNNNINNNNRLDDTLRRKTKENVVLDINCTVIEIITLTTPKLDPAAVDIDSLVCAKEDGFVYAVQMDDNDIEGLDIVENSGNVVLNIQSAVIERSGGYSLVHLGAKGTSYTVTYDPLATRKDDRRRMLGDGDGDGDGDGRHLSREKWTGHRSLAAFRIVATDAEPSVSIDEISDALFGTFGHKVTLKSRYEDCSFGKFSFEPAVGLDLRNGVQELHINVASQGEDRYTLQNAATEELIKRYGSNLAEKFKHVTYILPHGTYRNGGENWYAYGYVNAYLSVFNDEEITFVSTAVHEIGHNLGLQHSNFQGRSYRDTSGYMGLSYADTNGPLMCFNAAKSWSIGWFDDKKVEIDPTKMKRPWKGELVSFVDYPRADPASGQYIIIKVDSYYFIYNRAKGLNSGTNKFHNKVSISQAIHVHDDESEAQNPLKNRGRFKIKNFKGKGQTVIVQVCELKSRDGMDYAGISIYLSRHRSACGTVNQPTPIYRDNPSPPTGIRFWETSQGAQKMQSLDGARGDLDSSPVAAPAISATETSRDNAATAPLHSVGSLTCRDDQFQLSLNLKTDGKPEETSWKLYRLQDLLTVIKSPSYEEEFHHYNFTTCLKSSSTYGFRIIDDGEDGIASSAYGNGHFTLFHNGVEMMSGGEFQGVVEIFLTGPCTNDNAKLKVLVVSDSSSGETSWSLQSLGESLVDLYGGPYGSNVIQSAHACIPKSNCYRFTMSDTEQDGFYPGEGSYEVEFDGSLKRFSNFTSIQDEETLFGDCADYEDNY